MNHIYIEGNHNLILDCIAKSDKVRPFMLKGNIGSGRLHHILEFIVARESEILKPFSCDISELPEDPKLLRVFNGKSADITVVSDTCGAEEVRQIISDAKTMPIELKQRYIIFRNFNYHNKTTQDLVLKLLEDTPEFIYPVLTVTSVRNLAEAIISRVIVINMPALSVDTVKRIYENDSRYISYIGNLNKGLNITDVELARMYSQFQFESRYEGVFLKADSPYGIITNIDMLFKSVKESKDFPVLYVIEHFLNFWYCRFHRFIEEHTDNKSDNIFYQSVSKCLSNFSDSLFLHLQDYSSNYYISVQQQITSMFLSIYTIRKINKI